MQCFYSRNAHAYQHSCHSRRSDGHRPPRCGLLPDHQRLRRRVPGVHDPPALRNFLGHHDQGSFLLLAAWTMVPDHLLAHCHPDRGWCGGYDLQLKGTRLGGGEERAQQPHLPAVDPFLYQKTPEWAFCIY